MTDFEIGLYVAKLEQRIEKQEQEQKKNSERIQELEQIGLLTGTSKNRRIWAKECIIFPLLNATGKVVSLYGRSLTKVTDAERSFGRHFYLRPVDVSQTSHR